MDYGQFKTYEKVTNAAGFPRTRQEQGLFLLELGFSPELETHSINVPMTVEFSGFGDVIGLRIKPYSAYASPKRIPALKDRLTSSDPPVEVFYDPETDDFALQFLKNPTQRTRNLMGSLIFDPDENLTVLLVRLRG